MRSRALVRVDLVEQFSTHFKRRSDDEVNETWSETEREREGGSERQRVRRRGGKGRRRTDLTLGDQRRVAITKG